MEEHILWKGSFKNIFPRTSEFLHFFLPLHHPRTLNPYKFHLPDVPVHIVKHISPKNELAEYDPNTNDIVVDIDKMFKFYGIDNDIDFSNKKIVGRKLYALIHRLDNEDVYRAVLIHEYEHFMQLKHGLKKSEYRVSEKLHHLTVDDCLPLAKDLIEERHIDREINSHLREYKFDPLEIEARLAEWIFLLIKGHTMTSIKSLEKSIFGNNPKTNIPLRYQEYAVIYARLKIDLHKKKKHLEKLRENGDRKGFVILHSEIEKLERKKNDSFAIKKHLYVATMYMFHMEKEAVRVASLFKKRYRHLANVI